VERPSFFHWSATQDTATVPGIPHWRQGLAARLRRSVICAIQVFGRVCGATRSRDQRMKVLACVNTTVGLESGRTYCPNLSNQTTIKV
jgi:hypothetical protein